MLLAFYVHSVAISQIRDRKKTNLYFTVTGSQDIKAINKYALLFYFVITTVFFVRLVKDALEPRACPTPQPVA